jgi:hypothetical protein
MMNSTLTQTVNFSNDTYATIDREHGAVSIHAGQRVGNDQNWGRQVIAFLTLEQAEAIAAILYSPWSQPDEAYRDAVPAEYRADYIGDWRSVQAAW